MSRRSLLSDQVTPVRIYVGGISQEAYQEKIVAKVRKAISHIPITTERPVIISQESMEEDNQNTKEAILSLFVYKPRQTGFAAVAAMTQAAITNPDATVIAVVPGEDESYNDRTEREDVHAILSGTNAPIFDTENEAISYVAQCADEGITDPNSGLSLDSPTAY